MSYTEIMFAIVSTIIALVVGVGQIYIAKCVKDFETRQDARDEQRRKDTLYADATKFIQKYNTSNHESEILLLPFCVVAYKYNPIYPYRREIYRDFCSLTEEVQNEIIKRYGLQLKSERCDDFYSKMLDRLLITVETFYPNDRNIFYESGKYFHRALLNSGTKLIPEIRCNPDKDDMDFRNSKFGSTNKSSDMDYKTHITNLLAYHKNETPINTLFSEQTSLGTPASDDEILISYLCCQVAKYTTIYNLEDSTNGENIGYDCDFVGEKYMEDLFLNTLHILDNHTKQKE